MDKTRLKGPRCDIYRFQGLQNKIPETHQIVLVNRSKPRVRSKKGPRVGSTWKGGIFLGGHLQN
jgi:hypothetical protein